MTALAKDYYQLLDVPRGASDREVRQAFRRLARRYHPDVNPGNAKAGEQFKEINEAYQVLSDPESRRKYDQYGENWRHADRLQQQGWGVQPGEGVFTQRGEVPFDFGDLVNSFFGGGGSGRPGAQRRHRRSLVEQAVEVTLEEAFHGATRVLELTLPGSLEVKRVEVKVPPGVDSGSRVHITPEGVDLFLVVTLLPHPQFRRQGADLSMEVQVPLVKMILGGEVEAPTLTGRVMLKVPPETQNGRVFRLAGQGMPRLGDPARRGDLYATVRALLPTQLTEDERELLRRLGTLRDAGR